MKLNITSIINDKEAADALFEKISQVAPKGTENVFIGNAIVKIGLNSGFVVIEELEGLKKLGLVLEAVEANDRGEITVTFGRRTA